ncbi:hypothetical protein [Desulfurobacterium sp. TC5-1]|uniref:hypothetical protein n=1 Tax=Desulfurobacterium sp. TC5-1 TaxID=1158318 RepID=UPI0003B66BE9|nr:hypothetical protein [Desulfurobacterium sp. TC5-1]
MKLFLSIIFSIFVFSGNIYAAECVATTKFDNLCVTVSEIKSYYKKYKEEKLSEVGKGNWYFTLADLIDATKALTFEKILTHEAEKSGVEKTSYFKRYGKDIERKYKEINRYVDGLLKEKKITKQEAEKLRKRLKKAVYLRYLKKAYLNMELADYLKVTSDDIANFMEAHKGEYGFKKDPKHPKMKVISKVELVNLIRKEKRMRVAQEFGESLWKKYGVTLNKKLLEKIDEELDK